MKAKAGLGLIAAIGPVIAAGAGRVACEPLALPPGPQLFIDEALIESQENLRRRPHPPERHGPPIVDGKEDRNFQPYLTVLRDPQSGRFRMWYNTAVSASQSQIGYLESEDAVRWLRPHRVLEDPAKIVFGVSVLDEGAGVSDPARRYRLAWWNQGMWMAFSADGLAWKADPDRPVLTGINDILSIARDPYRDRYVAVFGFPSNKEDGYVGHTQNSKEGYRRCVGHSWSADGVAWAPPARIFKPDDRDEGITEFYSAGGIVARGGLLIGLLKVLRDDLPCEPGGEVHGLGYTVLCWTRDGARWERDREPFFDRNPEPRSWDRAMAWMDCQLPMGDEVYLYYGGYARGHKVERFVERQIGLARMKRDRYVAREAGEAEGRLRTPPLRLEAETLTLNVDARGGWVKAQVLDADGRPFPGFSRDESTVVEADALAAPVRWKRPLAELKGKTARLEFVLRKAKLFAFELGR